MEFDLARFNFESEQVGFHITAHEHWTIYQFDVENCYEAV